MVTNVDFFYPKFSMAMGPKEVNCFFCLMKNCEYFKAKIQFLIASILTVEDF